MGIVRKSSGFSLMELLVVLTIIGLFISVVPVLFSKGVSGAEFKGVARNIAASLRSARANAISLHQDTVVTFNFAENFYQISNDPRRYAIPKGISVSLDMPALQTNEEDNNQVYFFADGGASGAKLSIRQGENAQFDVLVDWLTGRIQILE